MKSNGIVSRLLLSFAVTGLCGLGAAAQTANPMPSGQGDNMRMNTTSSGLDAADQTFVKKAAQGGMAEVELGKLATERASNPQVKQFGQRMVDDHTKAGDNLKEVASSKSITLPDSLDAKDEALKQKLSGLSGAAFDQAYMADMVKDHTKDVAEFRQESTNAQDPAVKNFAAQTLPTLEDHLKQARKISQQVSGGAQQ